MKSFLIQLILLLSINLQAQWSTDPNVNNPICTSFGAQFNVVITGDGSGGAIIAWEDHRGSQTDIYTQRINFNGEVQWLNNGIAICTAAGSQYYPAIVSDGNGGAIITWYDYRNGYSDIYAQRIDSNGDVQWTMDGIAICTAPDYQNQVKIVSDDTDIYAQRIKSNGIVQWQTNGVAICSVLQYQSSPAIISDDSGGAIIAWSDGRIPSDGIYAQRVDSGGIVQWTPGGVSIYSSDEFQGPPSICSDGIGGAIITICDEWHISNDGNLYAQRINSNGIIQWSNNGVAISTAIGNQYDAVLVSDENEGAIIAWVDRRGGGGFDFMDIYASQVDANGNLGNPIPVELNSFTINVINDKVVLNWCTETETNNKGFSIERLQESMIGRLEVWESLGFVEGKGTTTERQGYSFQDKPEPGKYKYRLKQIDYDGSFEYSQEIEAEVLTPLVFSLEQNYPNPFNPSTTIKYQIPERSFVALKVYGVLGNEIATLVNEEKPAGTYEIIWNGVSAKGGYASGVYFYQLKAFDPSTGSQKGQAGQVFVETKKMILLR